MGLFNDDELLGQLDRRLRRIEDKLDRVLAHLGVPPEDEPGFIDEVRALMAINRKIDAIKLYRERTGVGLAEAKRAVEALD